MPEGQFTVREVDGVPVVSAPEDIDIGNAAGLRSALLRAAAGHPVIVVDLSSTEFCDSSGLNVLVRALRRAQADGGEVRLVATTAPVLRILSVTGVDTVLPLFASVAEALAGREAAAHPAGLVTGECG
jgi:anti-sigma B factor antagonist